MVLVAVTIPPVTIHWRTSIFLCIDSKTGEILNTYSKLWVIVEGV